MKVGSKVRCTDATGYGTVFTGETYTVKAVNSYGDILLDNGSRHCYRHQQFEVIEEAPYDETLTLQLGKGLSIVLDPTIPFSRKFAEKFLDVVYGMKEQN